MRILRRFGCGKAGKGGWWWWNVMSRIWSNVGFRGNGWEVLLSIDDGAVNWLYECDVQ